MLLKANYLSILILRLFSHRAFSLFDPRAEDLPQPDIPAVLPENRNYGLFGRPAVAPIALPNAEQPAIINLKAKRADPTMSAAALLKSAAQYDPAISAPASSFTAAGMTSMPTNAAYPYPLPTGSDAGVLSDTYALPPAYDPAQISSLFAADSSAIAEASSLLSVFPTESAEIVCTGVKDVDGADVTVCGLKGNPMATELEGAGEGTSGAGSLRLELGWEMWKGDVSWAFGVLGGIGAVVAFFL